MNDRCGAVSARQQRVTPEYIGKARRADRTYNGTRRNDVGPLEAEVKRHGRIDGLGFGAYGEASSDVDEQLVLQPGVRKETGEEWGHVMSWKRSQFSLRGLENGLV